MCCSNSIKNNDKQTNKLLRICKRPVSNTLKSERVRRYKFRSGWTDQFGGKNELHFNSVINKPPQISWVLGVKTYYVSQAFMK